MMTGRAEPSGTLATALAHAQRLLASDPRLAAEQAAEILKVVPGEPRALLMLGAAHRSQGDAASARDVLEPLARAQPNWADAHLELGLALAGVGEAATATSALRRAAQLKPDMSEAWRALGDQLMLAGDVQGADDAYAQQIKCSTNDPRLMAAAVALCDNKLAEAETLLRAHLKQFPTDVAAIRMFAEVAARLGRFGDSENLLERCLELAPSFTPARHNYAIVLYRQSKTAQALPQIDKLLAEEPRNPSFLNLKAAALGRIGDYQESISIYADVLKSYPMHSKGWMSYGHALKTATRLDDSINAYRKSIELQPGLGEAYWSLANLKTFRFTQADVTQMGRQLERTDLCHEDRFHLHFALGKAMEDDRRYAESFAHYEKGAKLRRSGIDYDPGETSAHVRRSKALFTAELFAERAAQGSPVRDPIFIVGLPRAGSTLIEQILSSHSAVEGTMELPDILSMARSLGEKKRKSQESKYPEVLEALSAEKLKALGEEYLERTCIQRKSSRPFFIDKMPINFSHLGFIHLILPNAKIIDARRHPLGCCFSGFKQHFARGSHFTYDLSEIGRYYRDYVELMAHFDAVLPGRVHRVFYENMVEDTEGEVRRLLDYCGLPFEPACLEFYANDRAVRTASSEQVRQPIFRDAVEHWRHYEPWLGPLKTALGDVGLTYPAVPNFDQASPIAPPKLCGGETRMLD
jgi:tetratricopeptide (TPR) repeat protein